MTTPPPAPTTAIDLDAIRRRHAAAAGVFGPNNAGMHGNAAHADRGALLDLANTLRARAEAAEALARDATNERDDALECLADFKEKWRDAVNRASELESTIAVVRGQPCVTCEEAAVAIEDARRFRDGAAKAQGDAEIALSVAERKLEVLEGRHEAIKRAALLLTDAVHRFGEFDPETRVGRAVNRVDVLIHGVECPDCRGEGKAPPYVSNGDLVEPDCKTCRGIGAVMTGGVGG